MAAEVVAAEVRVTELVELVIEVEVERLLLGREETMRPPPVTGAGTAVAFCEAGGAGFDDWKNT